MASFARIGAEFESILKRGLLEFAARLPAGAPEFRYAYHEVIEEAQHSLMFHEFVGRTGLDVPGMPRLLRLGARQVMRFGRTFPELFFVFVLGGEDPIDHVQRTILRSGREIHPLLRRIKYETGAFVALYKPYAERYIGMLEGLLENPADETPGWHASELETSQVMAYNPELVRMDRAAQDRAQVPEWLPDSFIKKDGAPDVEFDGYQYFVFPMDHGEFSRTGVIGTWPPWVYGKVAVWILLGAAPMLVRRRPTLGPAWVVIVPVVAAVGAWLAVTKPG